MHTLGQLLHLNVHNYEQCPLLSAMPARPGHITAAVVVTLLALLLVAPTSSTRDRHQRRHTLRVATYNIWNVMFNWEVRKHHIAALIHAADVDVVGFQEVRADRDEQRTQLSELKALLPLYKWHVYLPVQKVIPFKGAPAGWELEGLGILSRHPITATNPQPLTHQSPKDKNQRTVLHASLHLHSGLNVSLAVAHLSYDRWQQCVNVAEIMKHVRARPRNSIIIGDFNTYADYPWPLGGLLHGYFSTSNKCPKYAAQKNPTLEADLVSYTDAWAEVNPNKNGYTFSNMPQPGFQSRPDRILFSKSWRVHSCWLVGRGEEYASSYTLHITWTRLLALLAAAEDAFYSASRSRSCLHDCGPHGSCRCGVCVAGGDKNRCETPNCPECSADVYRNYLIVKALFLCIAGQFLVSLVLFVLQWRTRWKHVLVRAPSSRCSSVRSWCSLSDRQSASPKVPHSRLSILRLLRFVWPVLSLRPVYQLFVCCLCCVLLFILCLHLFEESLRVVYAILPEELNPSDHLMVVATAVAS
ncbi:uncharacterized protein LOC110986391 isoform X2 [Acanthaster planci]|uniref:Uncharacterized protein LOC110986391 isoform X2 n=1 Tax=Acanthaster planci TaxID=133434 RepID=A0A8B7ZE25_ACAPL|nr:uncharacterized protein LOC110986391 isoform X2 [Acanthaster planci]